MAFRRALHTLDEYIFGAQTEAFYDKEKEFYKNTVERRGVRETVKRLRSLKIGRGINLVGRAIPNVLELVLVGAYVAFRISDPDSSEVSFPWIKLAIAESTRIPGLIASGLWRRRERERRVSMEKADTVMLKGNFRTGIEGYNPNDDEDTRVFRI